MPLPICHLFSAQSCKMCHRLGKFRKLIPVCFRGLHLFHCEFCWEGLFRAKNRIVPIICMPPCLDFTSLRCPIACTKSMSATKSGQRPTTFTIQFIFNDAGKVGNFISYHHQRLPIFAFSIDPPHRILDWIMILLNSNEKKLGKPNVNS